MQRLGVAVVGCGIFGEIHASTYTRFERTELRMVCDIDPDRARTMAQKFGCEYATDLEAVVGDPGIQAVSVATPDHTHRDPCVALARAGKHLLIEKPLATSRNDALAIADAAESAGVTASVDFHNRYHPAFRSLRAKLDENKLGRPVMLSVRLSDRIEVATEWFGWSAHSGPEWFLGSHITDLACWIMGETPVRVFADGHKGVLRSRGVDCFDCVQIHLSFLEGMATLETSWIVPNTWPSVADFALSLQTTDGRVDFGGSHQGVTLSDPDKHEWPFLLGMTPIGDDDFGYFSLPIRDFARAVLDGTPAPVPLALGVRNVEIIEAALRSIETGEVVALDTA